MPEKHKLHNVRLDDEVWAAVKAMGCSLNQYLRASLLAESEQPTFKTTKDAMAFAQREKIPAVVPVSRPFKSPLLKPSEKKK